MRLRRRRFLMPGRFFLGLGTGENVNEHVLGERWPEGAVRFEMLVEAIEVIRLLWEAATRVTTVSTTPSSRRACTAR
jgi:alkanesulfonate monooxygenase SsuD/methylene tetrahydromethanopterin reductase-like flavin-dependent oxidoreductase (luciferase family)